MQKIHTDGIGNIAFHDGVVRVELVTTRQANEDKQEMTPAGSVAMSRLRATASIDTKAVLADKFNSAYGAM